MAPTAGTRLGPYEIVSLLGSGGMGEVHQATDANLKRAMAIKVLPEALATDPEVIRAAISRRSLFNAIHREAVVKVDFVVRKNSAYRIEEFGRRRLVSVDAHPLWMVAPEDLILSKLVWAKDSHSELQLRDVRGVLKFQRATLDRTYLDRWAVNLSVDGLLREVES